MARLTWLVDLWVARDACPCRRATTVHSLGSWSQGPHYLCLTGGNLSLSGSKVDPRAPGHRIHAISDVTDKVPSCRLQNDHPFGALSAVIFAEAFQSVTPGPP